MSYCDQDTSVHVQLLVTADLANKWGVVQIMACCTQVLKKLIDDKPLWHRLGLNYSYYCVVRIELLRQRGKNMCFQASLEFQP